MSTLENLENFIVKAGASLILGVVYIFFTK